MTITVYVHHEDSYPYAVLSEWDAENAFNELLDEMYEPWELMGTTIYAARALKECDPIAYREAFNNWTDANYHELEMPDELFGAGDEMDEWVAREVGDA